MFKSFKNVIGIWWKINKCNVFLKFYDLVKEIMYLFYFLFLLKLVVVLCIWFRLILKNMNCGVFNGVNCSIFIIFWVFCRILRNLVYIKCKGLNVKLNEGKNIL